MIHGRYRYTGTRRGPHGGRYLRLKCSNSKEGCRKHLINIASMTDLENMMLKRHYPRTPGSRPNQPAGARPPRTRSISAPHTGLVFPIRSKPISAPSIADSDLSSEADEVPDEEEGNDDKPQLGQRHLALKVEIGQLQKRKIQQDLHHDVEIWQLQKRKLEQEIRHDAEITTLKKRKLELEIGILESGVMKKTPSGWSVPIGKAGCVNISHNSSIGSNGSVPPE